MFEFHEFYSKSFVDGCFSVVSMGMSCKKALLPGGIQAVVVQNELHWPELLFQIPYKSLEGLLAFKQHITLTLASNASP